jgi:hypothetical protein
MKFGVELRIENESFIKELFLTFLALFNLLSNPFHLLPLLLFFLFDEFLQFSQDENLISLSYSQSTC